MSETPETPETPEGETTEEEAGPPTRAERRGGRQAASALRGIFSQASDQADRPGFRSQSNARSKAQKKGKKGKKKR